MNYEQLRKQPDGILFYENDLPSPVLLQKVSTIEGDIICCGFDAEFEQFRFGFREMENPNEKDFHVFTKEQLDAMNEFFMLAYFESK